MRDDQTLRAAEPRTARDEAEGDQAAEPMKLLRYRVTNYRSVKDSGWLDLDQITALVGVNESGKTNLLLPLWKLNPRVDGKLDPVRDYPKSMFGEIRAAPSAYRFILAEFDSGPAAAEIADLARIPVQAARRVAIARLFDGSYTVEFPDYARPRLAETATVRARLETARQALAGAEAQPAQEQLRSAVLTAVDGALRDLPDQPDLSGDDLVRLRNRVAAAMPQDPPAVSAAMTELRALLTDIGRWMAEMLTPDARRIDDVREAVLSRLPSFVYYSTWGNLDSEIYLPHVVENMDRSDIGAKEAAKVRTLRTLFGFVGLEPTEILELGRDFREVREATERRRAEEAKNAKAFDRMFRRNRKEATDPEAEMMAQVAEAKRTRSILLQSAGTRLGERFAEWWRVRDYRFRLEADGNNFRIWVSDSERPQEVELEERSTGLQWFLSFFLVFLQESRGLHRHAVLLLDEPGLSLHPLAQRNLSAFFDEISRTHQIVYTAHSPFLIDADRLHRARKVYVGEDGSTRVTADLCAPESNGPTAGGAAYAVRSAVNMAVAEVSFGGAEVVFVPGMVAQMYLSAIKSVLIGCGDLTPKRDILFAPAGNPALAMQMAEVLIGQRDQAPVVIREGADTDAADGTLSISGFVGRPDGTVEDLMPVDALAALLDRMERRPEVMFSDVFDPARPFVAQAEGWAARAGIPLHPDWRLDLARRMRDRLLMRGAETVPAETMARWRTLMEACLSAGEATADR